MFLFEGYFIVNIFQKEIKLLFILRESDYYRKIKSYARDRKSPSNKSFFLNARDEIS